MKLKVHLMFGGCCEDAMNFYKTVLGGKTAFLLRKKDNQDLVVSGKEEDEISHMVVKMPQFDLAGQDVDSSEEFKVGNNTKLVLSFNDLQSCKTVFEKFAVDAKITVPFGKTFFCDGFGELTDRYGISWIIMVSDDGYEA